MSKRIGSFTEFLTLRSYLHPAHKCWANSPGTEHRGDGADFVSAIDLSVAEGEDSVAGVYYYIVRGKYRYHGVDYHLHEEHIDVSIVQTHNMMPPY